MIFTNPLEFAQDYTGDAVSLFPIMAGAGVFAASAYSARNIVHGTIKAFKCAQPFKVEGENDMAQGVIDFALMPFQRAGAEAMVRKILKRDVPLLIGSLVVSALTVGVLPCLTGSAIGAVVGMAPEALKQLDRGINHVSKLIVDNLRGEQPARG